MSAITAVSIIGVAVATAAIVCVLSVFNGFQEVLTEKLDTLSPELLVSPKKGKVFSDADSIAAIVRLTPGVAVATPTLTDNALAICNTHEMPVLVKGVNPVDYARITSIRKILKGESEYFGAHTEETEFPEALLSIGSASQLGATYLGEKILLFAPRREGRINPANPINSFLQDSVVFTGYFQAQHSQYDQNLVIVPIEVARNLFQYENEASGVEVLLTNGTNPESVATELKAKLGNHVKVQNRLEQQEINFKMIKVEKWVTFLLLFFILIIASFNLISTLSMLVLEKQQSLRTLRSLGAPLNKIGSIFRWESLLVTLLGGVSGIILGTLLCVAQKSWGLIRLNGDPQSLIVTVYPVKIEAVDLLIVFLPILFIGLITGWIASHFANIKTAA